MTRAIVTAALLFAAVPARAGEAEFQIDPAHTSVSFSVLHMGLNRVRGEFRKFGGKVLADEATGKISKIEANAEASSVDTGIGARDDHLRSPDFFAAAEYPQLKLVSKSVRWQGDKFTAVVDMTIRGVTRPVTFTGALLGKRVVDMGQGKQLRAGYTATATLDRQQFGLKFNRLVEGVSVVSDEVTIEIEMQILRPLGPPASAEK